LTTIDFYILANAPRLGRERVACRLADKAFKQGEPLYIQAASDAQARALDDLLWTFRQMSFVPHGLADEGDAPVMIGSGDGEPPADRTLLINLDAVTPVWFSRFERVLEIVDADDERRARGRERFRFYKDRGYPLQTHKLTTT
jgi:DNA polymerase-3 subunit chi